MISCLICPFFKKYFFQKCPQNLGNFKKRLILFCISSGIFIGLSNGISFLLTSIHILVIWYCQFFVQFQCSRTVIIFQQTSIFNYSKWFLFKTIKYLFTLTKIKDEWGTMQTAWCFGLRSTKLLVYGSNRILGALDQLSQTLIC